VRAWQKAGEKVVFTNGCFDLVHLGHVDYLEKARNLGDRLVLGLNTDSSVSRFKGPERPLQDQNSRARVLAALQFVDLVVFFNEDTPLDLISQLLPNVLVKGSDYLAENIVGADVVKKNGGVVKTIDFVSGYSTTRIVEKIKKS
jgi:D-glycero-beta-D-manno-heptose 1-phosphate adenylyltransferase